MHARRATFLAPSMAEAPRDWWSEPFQTLVALGESITGGSSASIYEKAWPSLLAGAIGDVQGRPVRLVNPSVGGNVISPKVAAYAASGRPATNEHVDEVIEAQPDLLVISAALNDARGGTPVELFRTELEALIAAIRTGCDPLIVLLGPYFMVNFEIGGEVFGWATPAALAAYSEAVAEVAGASRCLFCDIYAAYGNAPWALHTDGLHANDLGHRIVANAIFQTLAQHCSGLSRGLPRWEPA